MYVLFVIVVAPVFLLLLLWAGMMAHRLYFPDKRVPLQRVSLLRGARAAGRAMPVGVREIREAQRQHLGEQVSAYHYAGAGSDGFPSDWVEDLWRRRN